MTACGAHGDCYSKRPSTPIPAVVKQLTKFILNMTARGRTEFKHGICKMIEVFGNHFKAKWHKRECFDTSNMICRRWAV